jgi:methyltransferase (TIGR00027 family)
MTSLDYDSISQTAIIVNQLKAEHHLCGEDPKIYSDPVSVPLAQIFAQQPILKAYRSLSPELISGAQSSVLLRSRYASDLFQKLTRAGCDQCILFGSGLDCFAYQARPEFQGVQLFELDRWTLLALKEEILTQCLYPKPHNLQFCPVDFKTDDLFQALLKHDYDPIKPAFITLFGVTQYIESSIFDRILQTILYCFKGTTFLVSYIVPQDTLEAKEAMLLDEFKQIARAGGEPFITSYHPQALAQKLKDFGFRSVQHITTEDVQKRYFQNRSDGLYANSVEQLILATV